MTRRQVVLHSSLFILTLLSTLFTGGPVYSAAIMTILTAHEMGHYTQCRRYGIPATLPFFIPMPISPFGTMGAVIRMQGPLEERRALFDIAVAGPLAGLVFALPAAIIGIHLSRVVDLTAGGGSIPLGDSILFKGLVHWIVGPIPAGRDLMLHPLAFAGWAGLFVTALNLLPIGQLDGGHILYALLGTRRALPVSLAFMGGFAVLGVFFYRGWALMIVLILIFGLRHPPFWEEGIALGRRRKMLGAAMLLFFVVSFTPTPIVLESRPARKPVERPMPQAPGVQVSIPQTQDGGPARAVPAAFTAWFEPASGSCP
jgi:membrane-associated protease RseP (regulator of RpoE activity)